ncbi:hypothetical protein [Cyclobacterium salsum]|uniref:hypothetical protein n=1 Tax=Cyclobacterium salsum TaxID=2666329 RepID=UPI0013911A85|nr:hypothetical protein [Cyclobacterium salsum]
MPWAEKALPGSSEAGFRKERLLGITLISKENISGYGIMKNKNRSKAPFDQLFNGKIPVQPTFVDIITFFGAVVRYEANGYTPFY